MPLVKDGKVIEDRYRRILDDSPVPAEGAVILPAARFLADAHELLNRSGATGVLWPNDRDVSELSPHVERLAAIALVFPNFRDGRAYSQARMLRERYRFHGELRATGQILRDQFLFLHRAGFDAFEVVKAADAQAFVETVRRYSTVYQPAADGRVPASRRRIAAIRPQPSSGALAS
jgi:uncharacterized protein (DUF934 family)